MTMLPTYWPNYVQSAKMIMVHPKCEITFGALSNNEVFYIVDVSERYYFGSRFLCCCW